MKRFTTIAFALFMISVSAYGLEPGDTTQVTDFTLNGQDVTMHIGESHQFSVTSSGRIRWVNVWDPFFDVIFVDDNGFVTALRKGNSYVAVESVANPNIRKQCTITVDDEGSLRIGQKDCPPVNEVDETEVQFSLSDNGLFTAEGTFWGSGAQTNYLNYIVTDQCIFLSFEIDYEDSTKMFYPQPFKLELEGCNAQDYKIYFNNKSESVSSQRAYASYSIARSTLSVDQGQTGNIPSDVLEVPASDIKETTFYNLSGRKINEPSGLTIVVTRLSDGKVHIEKKLFLR